MAQGGENCSTFAHWGPQCCSQARPLKTLDVELIPILPTSAPCTFHNVNQKLTCSISQSTCTTLLLVVSQNRCVSDPSSPTPTIQTCRAWPLTLFHNDLSQLESCHFGSVYWVYCLNVCHAESVPDICVTKYHMCSKGWPVSSACATAKRIDGKDRMVTMKIHRSHARICSCSSLKLSGTTSPATIYFSGWAKMRCRETQRERGVHIDV